MMPEQTQERIAKVIARSGLCSRRDAEQWIKEGRIKVNDKVIEEPGTKVGESDRIVVDGRPLPQKETVRLWCYYKPSGLVTTHKDPQGRPTVFEDLPRDMPRVISVGRLDQYSEGLLLLTNDGEFARQLEHPSSKLERTYRVQVYGGLSQNQIDQIQRGINIDGFKYQPIRITVLSVAGRRAWLEMTLQEGKNREIRNILAYFEKKVLKLIRESYGPFVLGDLHPGEVTEITNPQARLKQ